VKLPLKWMQNSRDAAERVLEGRNEGEEQLPKPMGDDVTARMLKPAVSRGTGMGREEEVVPTR